MVVSPTYGHNLGNVTGNGLLHVESGNLPAGNFSSFIDCANNGTIDYGGTGNYTIIASQYSSLPNLFFTGTGQRILPNKDLTICNRLKIDGPTLDNATNNRKLTILGSMERYNSGAFLQGTGANATVTFAGTSAQNIGGPTGNFTFNNMEINNSAGLSIGNNGSIIISTGNLLLTNGIITTTSTNKLTVSNTSAACVIPSGGSASSFINGPLTKFISSNASFTFPIGNGAVWGHQFILTDLSSGAGVWTAQYFSPNPTYLSMTAPLQVVNDL